MLGLGRIVQVCGCSAWLPVPTVCTCMHWKPVTLLICFRLHFSRTWDEFSNHVWAGQRWSGRASSRLSRSEQHVLWHGRGDAGRFSRNGYVAKLVLNSLVCFEAMQGLRGLMREAARAQRAQTQNPSPLSPHLRRCRLPPATDAGRGVSAICWAGHCMVHGWLALGHGTAA